jgi:hypothetical protein
MIRFLNVRLRMFRTKVSTGKKETTTRRFATGVCWLYRWGKGLALAGDEVRRDGTLRGVGVRGIMRGN